MDKNSAILSRVDFSSAVMMRPFCAYAVSVVLYSPLACSAITTYGIC